MRQIFKFGVVLGVICFLATFILALTYEVTKPKIEEAARKESEIALKGIFPDADSFEKKSIADIEYFDVLKGGISDGYCIKVIGDGYGGPIHLMVGIDNDGSIKGVRVLSNQETPGLGTKITETRPGEDEPYFLRQFKGKPASSLEVRRNVDAITGATISSKAVTDAIRKTVDDFMDEMAKVKIK